MVPTEDVQEAVYGQESDLAIFRMTELAGLAGHRRPADDDVSQVRTGLFLAGREGQDVGRVVLVQKASVESPQLAVTGEAEGQLPATVREPGCDLGHGGCRLDHRADRRGSYGRADSLHD